MTLLNNGCIDLLAQCQSLLGNQIIWFRDGDFVFYARRTEIDTIQYGYEMAPARIIVESGLMFRAAS